MWGVYVGGVCRYADVCKLGVTYMLIATPNTTITPIDTVDALNNKMLTCTKPLSTYTVHSWDYH